MGEWMFSIAYMLICPNPELQYAVEEDASGSGVGAILSQRSSTNQKLHPCASFTRRLILVKRNYYVGNQELLMVLLALKATLAGGFIPPIYSLDGS